MPVAVHEGMAAWRRLGLRRGARVALWRAGRAARRPIDRERARVRPPRADARALRRALGGASATAALRGPVLAALPAVATFERELEGMAGELLARADAIRAHRFDLLGSGETALGEEIDWLCDFRSGRRWPLAHISRVPIELGGGADIKVPWELSRGQHLPLLAAAHRLTGEPAYLDELGAQLSSWIAANPVEHGPNWACTMDAAIRAANWVAALCLCAEAAEAAPWREEALASLLLHGRFIRRHLEWGGVRGNHYLSDVAGLLPVAALFSGGREGRRWAAWAAGELEREMRHQVRPDGCAHEASIPYHRLVTELFQRGTEAVDALLPGRLPAGYRERLERMPAFTAAYTRPDGLVPAIGDGDDGRFLPLGDYGRADPRSHAHLLRGAPAAGGHAAFPAGGFYVMRAGDLYAIVRCGDTGLGGLGAHAHNDQLSFELALGPQPLVIDPGTYAYTGDPQARDLFRSTAFHATLKVGGAEQNPLEALFALPDRTRAEALTWEPAGDRATFAGRHHGFEALADPAVHERRFDFDGPARTLRIRDTVRSAGEHALEWTFPMAGGRVSTRDGAALVELERGRLTVASPGLGFTVEDGWYSPRFGVRVPVPFLRARRRSRPGEDVTVFELRAEAR